MIAFVYYAHPIGYYRSAVERREVSFIESLGYQVVNPADFRFPEGWRSRRIMDYCLDAVRVCDAVCFKRYANGDVGAGVAREVLEAHLLGKPVWEIHRRSDDESRDDMGYQPFSLMTANFRLNEVLTIEQTKARNTLMTDVTAEIGRIHR